MHCQLGVSYGLYYGLPVARPTLVSVLRQVLNASGAGKFVIVMGSLLITIVAPDGKRAYCIVLCLPVLRLSLPLVLWSVSSQGTFLKRNIDVTKMKREG